MFASSKRSYHYENPKSRRYHTRNETDDWEERTSRSNRLGGNKSAINYSTDAQE